MLHGNILAIVIIAFILFIPTVLVLCVIAHDIDSYKQYKRASRTDGRILEHIEGTTTNAYGSGAIGKRIRQYNQYKVEYEVQGIRHIGIVQTKVKDAVPGDYMEVRYAINEGSGVPEVVTCVYRDRLIELIIGSSIGIIFGIICVILETEGYI